MIRPVVAVPLRRGSPLASFASLAAALVIAGACSSPDQARARAAITPAYDAATGKLTELAYDSDHNGTMDTWTAMDGARPVLTRIDRNQDGKLDRWEYYDAKSNLVKIGFSRADDGQPDGWAFSGPDKTVERVEISSAADADKIDRWEHYKAGEMIAAEEDTNHDGAADKWETFESGVVKTAAFDENADRRPDRRLTYAAGVLVTIESEPDATGTFTKSLDVTSLPVSAGVRPPL